jgi:hypothetical protein
LKKIDTLASFMQNLKIDINSDIRNQAHSYLLKDNKIQTLYSGNKKISGILSLSDTCTKKFSIPYVLNVNF